MSRLMNALGSMAAAPGAPPGGRRPAVASLCSLVAGALATLGLFALLHSWEAKRVQSGLEILTSGRVAAIPADVSDCVEAIFSLREPAPYGCLDDLRQALEKWCGRNIRAP